MLHISGSCSYLHESCTTTQVRVRPVAGTSCCCDQTRPDPHRSTCLQIPASQGCRDNPATRPSKAAQPPQLPTCSAISLPLQLQRGQCDSHAAQTSMSRPLRKPPSQTSDLRIYQMLAATKAWSVGDRSVGNKIKSVSPQGQ